MKRTFPLLLLILALTASAEDLYVAANGGDSNPPALRLGLGEPSSIQPTRQLRADAVHVAAGSCASAAISCSNSGTAGSR